MDMNNWMADLDSTQSIAKVSIPGTHESGAILEGITGSQCQNLSISDQLAKGIRFLDIRLALDSSGKPLRVTHGSADQNLTFEQVLMDVFRFLKQNPSEFVLMNVQKHYEYKEGSLSAMFNEMVNSYNLSGQNYWFVKKEIPKVSEVRKRIVLIRAYDNKTKKGWLSDLGIPWNGFSINGVSENDFFGLKTDGTSSVRWIR